MSKPHLNGLRQVLALVPNQLTIVLASCRFICKESSGLSYGLYQSSLDSESPSFSSPGSHNKRKLRNFNFLNSHIGSTRGCLVQMSLLFSRKNWVRLPDGEYASFFSLRQLLITTLCPSTSYTQQSVSKNYCTMFQVA